MVHLKPPLGLLQDCSSAAEGRIQPKGTAARTFNQSLKINLLFTATSEQSGTNASGDATV